MNYPEWLEDILFDVSEWHVCLLAGFIIVTAIAVIKRPRDFPLSRAGLFAFSLIALYFGIVGAKLLYILLHWKEMTGTGHSFSTVMNNAGQSSLGGFTFEILAMAGYTKFRARRISFLEVGDYSMPFLILHQAFVRTGCFLNPCCYGKPTGLPWGYVFTEISQDPRHPTQIYSIIFILIVFFIMRYIYKKRPAGGSVFFGTIALYAFLRFFVEFLRADSLQVFGIITLTQIALISVIVLSLTGLITTLQRRKR